MQQMSQGLQAIADAMRNNITVLVQAPAEGVQRLLQGQAQVKVQKEECLTQAGKIVMLGVLAEVTNVQTYLVLQSATMRKKWIKLQLQCYGDGRSGILYDWFIDTDYHL